MSFGFAILEWCFHTGCGDPNIVRLCKTSEFLRIILSSWVNQHFLRSSGPAKPHLNQVLDQRIWGLIWSTACCLKTRGPIYNMINVVLLTILACPGQTIGAYTIIEIKFIFDRTRSGDLWLNLRETYWALKIQRSLCNLGSVTLRPEQCAKSFRTGMTQVFMSTKNHLLFFLWKSLESVQIALDSACHVLGTVSSWYGGWHFGHLIQAFQSVFQWPRELHLD